MSTIAVEYNGAVAIVRLRRGVTNALNPKMVNDLAATIESVKQDSNVHSMVLSSSSKKFFSIGLDVPQLFGLAREELELFQQEFSRICLELYTLPKPTVAAITGHAIAGGCILALCCDYRFIAEGRKLMGLNEVKLGLPVPYVADCVLRSIVGVGNAREIMEGGEFYTPEKLQRMGMVDQVLPMKEVVPASIQKAALLGAMPGQGFAIIKRNRAEEIEARVLERLEEKNQIAIDCWYSAEAREQLRAAMEKF